jgi:hypothetical protein
MPTTAITTTTGCPPPSTKKVTVTALPSWAHGHYYRPNNRECINCETVTYTNKFNHVMTIAVPQNPWATATTSSTSTAPAATGFFEHFAGPKPTNW